MLRLDTGKSCVADGDAGLEQVFTNEGSLQALQPAAKQYAKQPSPKLAPLDVVQSQLAALQAGDVQRCFAFASPNNKRATGPWQRFEMSQSLLIRTTVPQDPEHCHLMPPTANCQLLILPACRSGAADARLLSTGGLLVLRGRLRPCDRRRPVEVSCAGAPCRLVVCPLPHRRPNPVLRLEPLPTRRGAGAGLLDGRLGDA